MQTGSYIGVSDRRLLVQLTQEASASDFSLFRQFLRLQALFKRSDFDNLENWQSALQFSLVPFTVRAKMERVVGAESAGFCGFTKAKLPRPKLKI